MIDRQGGKLIFECDSCNETFEWDDEQDFNGAWDAAKRDGWRAKKIANEWIHECPNCH